MSALRHADVSPHSEPVSGVRPKPSLDEEVDDASVEAQALADIPNAELVSGERPIPVSELADHQLVKQAQAGGRWAQQEIFRRHGSYVTGMVLRILRSRSESEDVVQDVFVNALENLDDLRDGSALRGWLAQIAINLVRNRFRTRRLLRLLGLDHATDDATWEMLAAEGLSGEARAELAALDRVLVTLPREQRIAWILRHAEGMSNEEVAHACSCSVATAKRRIDAARARVRIHVTLNGGDSA